MAAIRKPLTLSELDTVAHLALDRNQEPFAGNIQSVLGRLRAGPHPEAEHPFAIVSDGETVGFFILREGPALPGWAPAGAITLHNLRIGRGFQNKGYGRTAMRLAAGWISRSRPGVDCLALAVNVRNRQARRFYRQCGCDDSGARHHGPIGEQAILVCDLNALLAN